MIHSLDKAENSACGSVTLVVGVDGSGKSTFLNGLSQRGFETVEPSSSIESRDFKANNVNTFVDLPFIDEREQLFAGMNNVFDELVANKKNNGIKVATTGSHLVTVISHNVMRLIVGHRVEMNNIVQQCASSQATLKPDEVVMIHAPYNIIRERISDRQKAGDENERFWGFNSPWYLDRYQETWYKFTDTLKILGLSMITLDSHNLNPDQMIEEYSRNSNI